MSTFRRTVLIVFLIVLPSTTIAQPSATAAWSDLDLRTAVNGLIIHSDAKAGYAVKIFGTVLARLCKLCDASPAYVASLLISMHKDVKEKGFDRKFVPVVMNYNKIVGSVDRIYAERGIAIENRSELCKTLAAMYMTVRPETKTADGAAEDIIDAYTAFLGK